MKKSDRRKFMQKTALATGLVVMGQPVLAGAVTPNEIEGPFYPVTPQKDQDFDLTQVAGKQASALGDVVVIAGQVVDTKGQPIEGATVDIWQANAAGRYNHPHDQNPAPVDENFQGWAIVQSGKQGGFKFKTVVPGAYPVSSDWTRPPHIHFKVSKSGYHEVVTQMYFPDHRLNVVDRLLQSKSVQEQKQMIAEKDSDASTLRYSITMKQI